MTDAGAAPRDVIFSIAPELDRSQDWTIEPEYFRSTSLRSGAHAEAGTHTESFKCRFEQAVTTSNARNVFDGDSIVARAAFGRDDMGFLKY